MATITFPSSPKPRGMQWKLHQPTQINVSEWTGRRQVQSSNRGWWECRFTLPPIVGRDNFNPWRSFLAQARGGANDFQVPIDNVEQAANTGNTARVNGGFQTGRSLTTNGWPASQTILQAGQFVTINDQLLQLTADVATSAGGTATIEFEPPIRVSPADNAVIEYRNPYALMYLVEIPSYDASVGDVYGLSMEFREVV